MNRECGFGNADCGFKFVPTRRTGTAYTIRNPKSAIRNGVTLIELLITITIIATLSAAFLGASRAAMEHARAARTKSTIAKLHTLLMEHWASYTTRRVDVDTSAIPSPIPGETMADIRLMATRQLMRLEMPDRWSDILGDETVPGETVANAMPSTITGAPATKHVPGYAPVSIYYPVLARTYLRRYFGLNPSADAETIESNQGAECLYMIIMLATGDGEARTLFSEQDIGDTDEDGAPEFLDGWGRPIHFLRWPAGFVDQSDLMTGDPDADHDPFDHFRRDDDAYRLVPLIYSGGPDGDPDLFTSKTLVTDPDPYFLHSSTTINGTAQVGAVMDSNPAQTNIDPTDDGDNWLDNIHNHLQEGR